MSYTEYNNLKNPNEVLSAMADFFKAHNYNILQDVTDDMNIYDRSSTDGKKLIVNDVTRDYTLCFRSANGTNIFGSSNDSVMDSLAVDKDPSYYGIGFTIGEGYSSVQRWYNQYDVPTKWAVGANNKDVLGLWLPVPPSVPSADPTNKNKPGSTDDTNLTYTLFCNYISLPSNTVVFTLMRENSYQMQVAHMAFGNVTKYEDWTGGIFMSASANRYMMRTAYKCFSDVYGYDSNILPLFGTSDRETNTLVRIDIDDAPNVANQLMSDDYFDGDEAQAMLQQAIAKLPEVQRTVFNLRYYDDMKYSEISKILNTSVGALKASYHIAVKKIKEELDK